MLQGVLGARVLENSSSSAKGLKWCTYRIFPVVLFVLWGSKQVYLCLLLTRNTTRSTNFMSKNNSELSMDHVDAGLGRVEILLILI